MEFERACGAVFCSLLAVFLLSWSQRQLAKYKTTTRHQLEESKKVVRKKLHRMNDDRSHRLQYMKYNSKLQPNSNSKAY